MVFYPVPRFRRQNATAQILTVKGLRVEIFLHSLRKNTTRPLTVRIGGTAAIGFSMPVCDKGSISNAAPWFNYRQIARKLLAPFLEAV